MKKSKSIFTRLLLLILPLVLIADMIILAIAYALTYQSNLEQNRERVELVSREVAQYFESFDPNIPSEFEHTAWYLDSVCALTDMTYIYCVVPDPTDSSIRFLSIGFGKDAAEEARQSRYPGVVVPDVDDPELFATMNGQLSGNFRVEHNEYGDMLISYTPVTRHYDSVRHDYVDNDIQSVVGVDMSVQTAAGKAYTGIRIVSLAGMPGPGKIDASVGDIIRAGNGAVSEAKTVLALFGCGRG